MRKSGQEEKESRRQSQEGSQEENHQEEEIGAIPHKVAGKDLRGKGVRKGGNEEESCSKEDKGQGCPQEEEEIGVPRWGEVPPAVFIVL